VQQGQGRLHADEDAEKERGHFQDRAVAEAVAVTDRSRAEGQ
jgi:hypothetical protein